MGGARAFVASILRASRPRSASRLRTLTATRSDLQRKPTRMDGSSWTRLVWCREEGSGVIGLGGSVGAEPRASSRTSGQRYPGRERADGGPFRLQHDRLSTSEPSRRAHPASSPSRAAVFLADGSPRLPMCAIGQAAAEIPLDPDGAHRSVVAVVDGAGGQPGMGLAARAFGARAAQSHAARGARCAVRGARCARQRPREAAAERGGVERGKAGESGVEAG